MCIRPGFVQSVPMLLGWLRRAIVVGAIVYFAALVILVVALRSVGERTWWLMVVLYAPRMIFLLPLLIFVPAALWLRSRSLLLLLSATLVIGLFPFAGLTVWGWRSPSTAALDSPDARAQRHALRIFSHNVWFGHGSIPPIVEAIERAQPDVVALQGVSGRAARALRGSLPGWNFYTGPDLMVATRLPIEAVYEPPTFSLGANDPSASPDPDLPLPEVTDDEPADVDARTNQPAMFVRLTLTTPWGPVDFYDLHPYSPRHAIEDLRGDGWRSVLRHGVAPTAAHQWARNLAIRAEQVRRLAVDVADRVHPVVLAGDSNLPSDSALFRHYLARFSDGFSERGFGLGYTFPAHRNFRWLRIDRVLAGPGARILDFAIVDKTGSDHRPVLADVEITGR